ncbi:MAG: DUF6159 family protein [Microthrixaceae bacterium]
MRQWGNSKELTRASYGLVKENPGMYRWTIRAAVHGAVVGGLGVLVGLGLVALGAAMADGSAGPLGIVVVVLGVLLVLGGMIGGLTAANTQLAGLVSATDDVLHGRELDEDAARSAAHSRFRALAAWSAISVGVNAIVSMISGDGDSGFAVTIVRSLLAGLVAAVWAVVTTLVMPVIVLEDAHAVAAIKRSASIIRGTWGEAVLGSVRIGARFGLMFSLPGALLLVGGAVLGFTFGGPMIVAGVLLVVAGVALVITGAVKAATCRNVFGVALYRWATGEGALGPFSEADLRGAVQVRDSAVPVA